MHEIAPVEVPQLRDLLGPILKGNPLIVGGLTGELPGVAIVDDVENPTACLLRMEFLGGTYFVCDEQSFVEDALQRARRHGEVRLIFEHPAVAGLRAPDGHTETWTNVTFTHRPLPDGPAPPLPDGCRLAPITPKLDERSMWSEFAHLCNPPSEFHDSAKGYALMRGDEILSEAWSPFWADGMVEIGIATAKEHQRKGFGTIACEHLCRACEGLGWHPVWHTGTENVGSMRIAENLGFTDERIGPGYLYPELEAVPDTN